MTQRLHVVNRLISPSEPSREPFFPALFLPTPVRPGWTSMPRPCKERALQGPSPRCIIPWIEDPAPGDIPTATRTRNHTLPALWP